MYTAPTILNGRWTERSPSTATTSPMITGTTNAELSPTFTLSPALDSQMKSLSCLGYVSASDGGHDFLIQTKTAHGYSAVRCHRFGDFVALHHHLHEQGVQVPCFRVRAEGLIPFSKMPKRDERTAQLEGYLRAVAITLTRSPAAAASISTFIDFCTQGAISNTTQTSSSNLASYQVQSLAYMLECSPTKSIRMAQRRTLSNKCARFNSVSGGHRIAWVPGKTA